MAAAKGVNANAVVQHAPGAGPSEPLPRTKDALLNFINELGDVSSVSRALASVLVNGGVVPFLTVGTVTSCLLLGNDIGRTIHNWTHQAPGISEIENLIQEVK